jgi:hypothetical protein
MGFSDRVVQYAVLMTLGNADDCENESSGKVPMRGQAGKLPQLNSRLLGAAREEMLRNSAITMRKQGITNKGSGARLADIT